MPNQSARNMLSTQANQTVYLLLDGATFPAMQRLYHYEASPNAVPLFFGTRHDNLLEVSPCLYQPGSGSTVWAHEEEWRHHGVVLVSESPFLDVLAHLKRLVSVQLPNGQLAYWRFYSPSWLSALMSCFSSEERANFTGPVTQWLAWKNNAWERHTIVNGHVLTPPPNDGWFALTQRCLDALNETDDDVFYEAIESSLVRELTQEKAAAVNRARSKQMANRARSLGFHSHAELTWFLHAHYSYPEIMQQPNVMTTVETMSLTPRERQHRIEAIRHGLETEDLTQ